LTRFSIFPVVFLVEGLILNSTHKIKFALNSRSTSRVLIMDLEDSGYSIKFLWAPSHVEVEGNEKSDVLAESTCKFTTRSVNKTPSSEIIPHFHKVIRKRLMSPMDVTYTPSTRWYTLICPGFLGFSILIFLGFCISGFSWLRFGHNHLPAHAYTLNLNSSPFCSRHDEIVSNFSLPRFLYSDYSHI